MKFVVVLGKNILKFDLILSATPDKKSKLLNNRIETGIKHKY